VNPGAPDLEQLLRDLGLTEAEIAERKAFLEFRDEDVRLLTELHGLLEAKGVRASFVDAFYRHLQAFDGTRALLRDAAVIERLKRIQAEYFSSLTAGAYGPDYVRHRVRVGLAHERVGLAPKWYIGAYNKYLNLLIPEIGALLPGDSSRAQRMALALLKIVLFDMELAMDTYIHASEGLLQRKNAQLEAINRVVLALTSAQELAVILDQAMVQGAELVGAGAACIAFYDTDAGRFMDWVTYGLSPQFVQHIAFRPGGLAEEAFTTGTPVFCNDRPETRHQLSRLARDEGIRGFVCLPLTSRSGRLGVIYFYRRDRDDFEPAEVELLVTFAHIAASAIENARLYARLESEARTDALTGLYNRRVFERRLDEEHRRARRYGKSYALLMLDVDHFKGINDQYGHPAGDAVLAALGRLLALQVRDVDTAARYGGEEFAVILPEISSGAVKEIGERVCRRIAATPFTLPDGRQIHVTVSIGISSYPGCAADVRSLVSTADQALYLAKQAGRNRVLLYRETLKARLEKDPGLIVALLTESLDHARSIAAAVSTVAPFLRHHTDRVMQATSQLADALRLPPADRETLRLAALLHDIGMLTIPGTVLNKHTPLAAEEQQLIRQHPLTAAAWLAQVPGLENVVPVVRQHHERFDGRGYPDGLRGEQVSLLARALALADAYASMIGEWPGRHAYTPREALAKIRAGAGTQFDPQLVEEFLRALEAQTA